MMLNCAILLAILALHSIQFTVTSMCEEKGGSILRGKGAFLLNGIFRVTEHYNGSEKVNYQSGFMMAEALRFAVELVNKKPDFLYGYQLKINKMYDVSSMKVLRQRVLDTFLDVIPFLIGPYSSETTFITGMLTGTFQQPAISYSSTYSDYHIFKENVLRTVPSDAFRMRAGLDVIKRLKWKYISIVSSKGYDGEVDAGHFIKQLTAVGVCTDESIDLPKLTHGDLFDDVVEKLDKNTELKHGVVLFTNNNDSFNFFAAVKRKAKQGKFLIICMSGCINFIENIKGHEDAAVNTLSLDVTYPEIPGFKDFLLKQKPTGSSKSYFNKTWENLFQCSLNKSSHNACRGNETFGEEHYFRLTPVYAVVNTIFAIADAIHLFIGYVCCTERRWIVNGISKCHQVVDPSDRINYLSYVYNSIKRMSYVDGTIEDMRTPYERKNRSVRYDIRQLQHRNNMYTSTLVGSWFLDRLYLNETTNYVLQHNTPTFWMLNHTEGNSSSVLPPAICSKNCTPGYKKVPSSNVRKSRCCWTCVKCDENSISIETKCIRCKNTENAESNKCVLIPQLGALHMDKSSYIFIVIFYVLAIIGLIMVLIVVVLFIKNNGSRVVRSSSRDLCYMMLLGLVLLFSCPIAYMRQPSTGSCIVRGLLPGFSFLLCYAPLFMRTARIYRIFVHAKISVKRPALISPQSQVLVMLAILTFQTLLVTVWYTSKTPVPNLAVSPGRNYISVRCIGHNSAISMLVNLAVSLIFVLSCTILAFKTRHYPKNYNEAKFIGITLYITCVIWAVFLPTYYLTPETSIYTKEYLMCFLCMAIGYVTLFGLFGQKVRLLFWPKSGHADERQMWSLSQSSNPCIKSKQNESHI